MTNLIDALHIPDTQSARDDRHLAIQRVGVRGVRYPMQLRIEGAVVPTGVESLLEYQGRLIAEMRADVAAPRDAAACTIWIEVVVPVKSLCPCSKEISDYGAHNQRSHVTIRVESLGDLSWLELVRFAEDS